MIRALIAWGIGFSCGVKYVVTRGLGIGAPPAASPLRLRMMRGLGR
jgi:hypothetical protein